MTNDARKAWHPPRVTTVMTTGPLRCCVLFTLFDGRRIVVPDTPTVVNSGDEQNKALAEKRKAREREQRRLATRACRARQKQINPVTKRIDPVSVLKASLPYSVLKDIDAAAINKLEDNPRDADGKPISFEEARAALIADFVKAAVKK